MSIDTAAIARHPTADIASPIRTIDSHFGSASRSHSRRIDTATGSPHSGQRAAALSVRRLYPQLRQ